jgi:hypothetical protein
MHECNAWNRSSLLQRSSCSPRALHEGPLVADADVQAEYADAASAPNEIEVVEHGLDAGQVHELDQGGGAITGTMRPELVAARPVSS